jgi:hypothetical protein
MKNLKLLLKKYTFSSFVKKDMPNPFMPFTSQPNLFLKPSKNLWKIGFWGPLQHVQGQLKYKLPYPIPKIKLEQIYCGGLKNFWDPTPSRLLSDAERQQINQKNQINKAEIHSIAINHVNYLQISTISNLQLQSAM